jgi:hypothetical protein
LLAAKDGYGIVICVRKYQRVEVVGGIARKCISSKCGVQVDSGRASGYGSCQVDAGKIGQQIGKFKIGGNVGNEPAPAGFAVTSADVPK